MNKYAFQKDAYRPLVDRFGGGGLHLGGVCIGGSASKGRTSPVNRMTDRCKYITLPQTSFVGSNKNRSQGVLPQCMLGYQPTGTMQASPGDQAGTPQDQAGTPSGPGRHPLGPGRHPLPERSILGDTANERAVCILLE